MPNLKEVRNRISSVNSTMQITSAMKMVSAAKLRRAQDRVTQMRPYAQKLTEILGRLTSTLDPSENKLSAEREVKNVLLVLITSNRGLCGGFNAAVIKAAKEKIQNNPDKTYKVVTVGKKAFDFFKKTDLILQSEKVKGDNHLLFDDLNFDAASEVPNGIVEEYLDGKFDEVHLVYNRFKNAATQVLEFEQFLPVLKPETEVDNSSVDYLFEPTKNEIIEDLIPKSLKTQFYKAVLDSNAAEHGARMTAMHKATDNAKDLLDHLKLSYNKARQAAITNEILEIVGGANALDDA